MMAKLSTTESDIPLLRALKKLFEEQEPPKINVLKKMILALVKTRQADILTRLNDGANVLQKLLQYYQRFPANDDLHQFLNKFVHSHKLLQVCGKLFKQRWDDDSGLEFSSFLTTADSPGDVYNEAVKVKLTCRNIAEAALAAFMLETALYENYNIPMRSATKILPVVFDEVEGSNQIEVVINYRPEDYLNIEGPPNLRVRDELLAAAFCGPEKDFYSYYVAKYGVQNTRGMSISYESKPPERIAAAAFAALAQPGDDVIPACSARLLIVTRTGLGVGNFINARVAIEGICRKMPQVQVDWVIANDGDSLPITGAISSQVTVYETDALWKLFPLIRALSLTADLVVSLPNNFLSFAENELPGIQLALAPESPTMVLLEYNATYDDDIIPPHYLIFGSGVNAGGNSLGLLRPGALDLPLTLDEKRVNLCKNKSAAGLFRTIPGAPLYFGYAYLPEKGIQDDIQGLKMVDILALFVQHAKFARHTHIKIVLPLDVETIRASMRIYPAIFADCKLSFTNATSKSDINEGAQLNIEIFNLFPFENIVFRSLMDYAAACNTPVVCTGDQSLMEIFFTMTEGFLYLYQLLSHKADMFKKIKEITLDSKLSHLYHILGKLENSIGSDDVIYVAKYLIDNQVPLKTESVTLAAIIKNQPDLVDGLTRVISAVTAGSARPEEKMELAAAASI